MNKDEDDSLYKKDNIAINIDSKKINISSGEIILYSNFFIIKNSNSNKEINISYNDINFYAIEKQKKMILLSEGKKYDIINIFCNNEDEIMELFNQFCSCINVNEDNFELDEDIDKDKLLLELAKKMVFNNNEKNEKCDEENNLNK